MQGLCASLVPNILYNIYIYIRIYNEGERFIVSPVENTYCKYEYGNIYVSVQGIQCQMNQPAKKPPSNCFRFAVEIVEYTVTEEKIRDKRQIENINDRMKRRN